MTFCTSIAVPASETDEVFEIALAVAGANVVAPPKPDRVSRIRVGEASGLK